MSYHHWEISHFTWKSNQLQIIDRILLSAKMKGNVTPTKPEENIFIIQQVKEEDGKAQGKVYAEQTRGLTPAYNT